MLRRLKLFAFVSLVFLVCCDSGKENTSNVADTIYTNGKIYTVNESQPWAEAVAVKNGKFMKVGSNDDIITLKGTESKVIDLEGKFVMPGIHDVHIHTLDIEADKANGDLSLPHGLTRDELLETIKAFAEANPDKEWITGGEYPMMMFPNENAPKELLDAIVPDRPVAILHQSGHALWVNSKALEMAGITADTKDPPLGIIVRQEGSQEPLGTLKESAQTLVADFYWVKSPTVYEEAVRNLSRFFNSHGITSVKSASGRLEHWEALKKVDKEGGLNLNFTMSWNWSTSLIEPRPGNEEILKRIRQNIDSATGRIRCNSLKIFMDGSIDSHTAGLFEHYHDNHTSRGILNMGREELEETTAMFDEMGVSILYHCIGDSAASSALDAVEFAREQNGDRGMRHQISHSTMILKEDIDRVVQLGACMDFSPILPLTEGIKSYAAHYLGDDRTNRIYPARWGFEAGANPAFASDHSVTPVQPFVDLEIMITRGDPFEDKPGIIGPDLAITIEQALRAITINGAYVMMQEGKTGSIEEGKSADFVILDRNLLEIHVNEISETEVLQTFFEGKSVFENANYE